MSPSLWSRISPVRGFVSKRLIAALSVLGILSSVVLVAGSTLPAGAATTLPSSIHFEQWDRTGNTWVPGNLSNVYNEGEVVPFRVDVTGVPAGQYQFSICRTYINNAGTAFGYLSLARYDTTVTPVVGATTIGNTVGPVTAAFTGGGVTIDSVTEVGGQGACSLGTQRETIVVFTITDTPTAAYVLFGGRLAAPTDAGVGIGHGASQFMGSSLHMELLEPAKSLPINVGPETTGLVTIIKNAIPDTSQSFSFTPSVGINEGNTFQLVDNGTAATAMATFTVTPGPNNPLTVREDPAASGGYVLSAITCTSTMVGDTSAGNLATATATFDVSPGEHVTCTFTNVMENTPTGRLEVRKVLSPATDMGTFDLAIDGMVFAPGVGNGGTTGPQMVSVGTHTVSEAGAGTTNLANYRTTIRCTRTFETDGPNTLQTVVIVPPGGGTLAATTTDVPVAANDLVVCTITNTRGRGTLEVVKHLVPPTDTGRFDLVIDGTTDRAAAGNGDSTGPVAVDAGTHMVSEVGNGTTNLADYASSILCTHLVNGVPVAVASGAVTSLGDVPVAIGDAVTCTITNARNPGTVTIVKDSQPNSTQDFTFTPSAGLNGGAKFLLDDDGNNADALPDNRTFQVAPGTYTVTEAATSGFELTSIHCDDPNSTGNLATGVATIVVASGQHVTCTFTNLKHGVYGNDPAVNPTEHPYDPSPNPGGQGAGDTGQNGGAVTPPSTGADPSSAVAGTDVAVAPVAGPGAGPAGPVIEGVVQAVKGQVNLARTGAAIARQAVAGLILIGVGLVLLALRRRRSSPDAG